ncbi:uncharacterized protein PAC_17184 [Phialocephala subalpina]|uniref:Protein argonaute N-terminal domain-containing protein n=1 Tax=Phialocephala subalpina TaxID=576137 RepID=A0A1L7XQK7_9HELO|nr:uncharacterized protein PAC_17184 [Phialocephala subalpina]
MAVSECSKCWGNDDYVSHNLRGCKKDWPFWEDQVCDRCFKVYNHDFSECKLQELILSCTECGHEGNYNTKDCQIANKNNEQHVRQWTKVKYEQAKGVKASKQIRSTTASSSRQPATSIPGSSQQMSLPMHQRTNPSSSNASGSRLQPALKIRPIGLKRIFPSDLTTPFLQLPFRSEPGRPLQILANFFKVELVPNSVFHKYRIHLGEERSKDVKKAEVKRALIWKLLHVQRPPPQGVNFVSDYYSCVYSDRPLYEDFDHDIHKAWLVPHRLSPIPGEAPAVMKTTVADNQPTVAGYFPDEDIRALNVVTWKNINNPDVFSGGVNGKKFYPDLFSQARPLTLNQTKVYILSRGYFSSPSELHSRSWRCQERFSTNIDPRQAKTPPGNVRRRSTGSPKEKKTSHHLRLHWDSRQSQLPKNEEDPSQGGLNVFRYMKDRYVEWQPVKGLIDPQFTEDIVKAAEQSAQEYKESLETSCRPSVSADPLFSVTAYLGVDTFLYQAK